MGLSTFFTHPLYWVPLYNHHFKALIENSLNYLVITKKMPHLRLLHTWPYLFVCFFFSFTVFGPTDAPKDNLENMVSSNALNVLMQSSLLYSPTDSPYAGLL